MLSPFSRWARGVAPLLQGFGFLREMNSTGLAVKLREAPADQDGPRYSEEGWEGLVRRRVGMACSVFADNTGLGLGGSGSCSFSEPEA